MSTDLDLQRVLWRIVVSACELTGAKYGALGVLRSEGGLASFVTHGIDDAQRALIGDLPRGRGILGTVIQDPKPLRLTDLHDHPDSFGFPPGHPPMHTFLGVPIRVQGAVFGNLYLTEKSGGAEFTEDDEDLVVGLAGAAGFVIGNARAYGLSERRREWLEATARLDEALQPPVALADALAETARLLRSVSGARAAAVLSGPDHADGFTIATADGPDASLVPSALEEVHRTRANAAAAVVSVDIDGQSWPTVLAPLRAALADPVTLMAMYPPGEEPPGEDELGLFQAFADHAGLAIDRLRAVEEREELVVVSERERIARDLHDLVIQRLFATGMHLEGVRMAVTDEPLGGQLKKAADDIGLTIKDIRGTIFELQSRSDDSLRASVRKLVKEYVPLLGFSPAVRTTGPVDTAVPDSVTREVLAVLREALSNIARHALAESAAVELEVSESHLRVQVSDDGTGVQAERQESGLRNARRRATALGGTFALTPNSPTGTVFTWRVPLP